MKKALVLESEKNSSDYPIIQAKVTFLVTRDMVEMQNIAPLVGFLNSFKASPEKFAASIIILFEGYDDDIRDVYEIPEIRIFYEAIFSEFPSLLLFLNRDNIYGTSDFELFFLMMTHSKVVTEKIGGTLVKPDMDEAMYYLCISLLAIGDLLQPVNIRTKLKVNMINEIDREFLNIFNLNDN